MQGSASDTEENDSKIMKFRSADHNFFLKGLCCAINQGMPKFTVPLFNTHHEQQCKVIGFLVLGSAGWKKRLKII